MSIRHLILLTFTLLMVSLAGCGEELAADGTLCEFDSDCQSDLCIFNTGGLEGYCSSTCNTNATCPNTTNWECEKIDEVAFKVCVQK